MKKPRNIGLFTWRQVRNETPFTFLAEILIGLVLIGCGVMLCILSYDSWKDSGSFVGPGLFGLGLILTGIFQSHAGVIFWVRQVLRKPNH